MENKDKDYCEDCNIETNSESHCDECWDAYIGNNGEWSHYNKFIHDQNKGR